MPHSPDTFLTTSLHLRPAPVRRVPPRFSIPPADSEIMPGGNVNITCVAVGSPMPYVKWMLGAEDLTPEDDMPIGRNVLELTDVRQSNNYTCVAMSTLGVIEAVAQIIVKGEEGRKAVDGLVFKRSIFILFSLWTSLTRPCVIGHTKKTSWSYYLTLQQILCVKSPRISDTS